MPTGRKAEVLRWGLLCGAAVLTNLALGRPADAAEPAVPVTSDLSGQLPTALPATPAPERPEDVIVVTGSRIPHPNLTATSPLTVIDSREVKLQGAILTESLINTLPQAKPDQGVFLSNAATGTATVDLRGFGAARTLVLINGRRLLPGDANYPAPDVNFVPSALIKRVEVLTGGASSVYGSDAVAGVVNFILETHLQGIRLDGQAGIYEHDNRDGADVRPLLEASGNRFPTGRRLDGGMYDINAAAGRAFGHGQGHATVYAGYRKLSAISQGARDYSACAVQVSDPDAAPFCGGSPASPAGTFFDNFGHRFHTTADRRFAPGRSLFNIAPYNYYQRPGRRYTAGGFADIEVSQAFKPYLEVMFMDDRTVAQVAPSGAFQSRQAINCDNPLLSDQERAIICADGNLIGQTPVFDDDGNLIEIVGAPTAFTDPVTGATYNRGLLIVNRRNVEGGPRQETLRHRDWRAVGGVKGELIPGLTYDASYVHGSVKNSTVHTNDLSVARVRSALDVISDPASGQPVCRSVLTHADPDCLPWDIFATDAVTSAAAAYLSIPSKLFGTVKQDVATAYLTANLGTWELRSPWAVDAPGLNLGLEYRKDELSVDPDEHYQNADLSGLGTPVLALTGSTSVKELFAEARLPLVSRHLIEELAIEAGYRLSWYSNSGRSLSSSNYKLGVELAPVAGVRLRASQQRAVRAANVQELFAPTVVSAIDTDRCAGLTPQASAAACAAAGVTAAQYGHILKNPIEEFTGDNAITGGNPDLNPETATTRTVGVVLQPRFLRGFTATLDWFDIRLKGAIGTVGGQLIMDTCIATADPFFCGKIHRDANGSLWQTPEGFVDDRNANIAAFETSGIDVGSTYTRSIGKLGSANLEFIGTWTHKFLIDPGGLSTAYDCAGLYGQVCGFPLPRWRHNARITWDMRSGLSLSFLWRHFSDVPIDAAIANDQFGGVYHPMVARIDAQNYFDLTGLFRLAKGYSLRFGVRNLLDRQPPLVASGPTGGCAAFCSGNTYPQLYDPLGRYLFAGATIDLH